MIILEWSNAELKSLDFIKSKDSKESHSHRDLLGETLNYFKVILK